MNKLKFSKKRILVLPSQLIVVIIIEVKIIKGK